MKAGAHLTPVTVCISDNVTGISDAYRIVALPITG